ncbi:MAG: peptidoglycan DD-metalloendopeptidase family protein [Patescibacteria group bacterium]
MNRGLNIAFFLFFFLLTIILLPKNFSYAEAEIAATTEATEGESVAEVSVSNPEIDKLRDQISNKNSELEKIEAEIAGYQKQIDETGKEAGSLKKLLEGLKINRSKLLAEIKATENKISTATINIRKLDLQIQDKDERIKKVLDAFVSGLRTIDLLESQTFIELILSDKKIYDIWENIDTIQKVGQALRNRTNEIKSLKQGLEGDKSKKETEKKKLLGFKAGLADQKKIVENNTSQKNKLLKETKNKESEYKKILEDRLAKKEQLEAEIFDFESKLQVEIDPTSLPKVGKGILSWPLEAIKITQYFGNTPFASKNPQVYNRKGHNGIDLRASVGTKVLASLSGRVVDTGNTDTACYGVSYGKWVLIEHNNGLTTLYAHLDLIKVIKDQAVEKGQVIGYSGNTGYSTGPHLHFAVFASKAVHVSGLTEYRSRTCGTYLKLPVSPINGYLNPLSYL